MNEEQNPVEYYSLDEVESKVDLDGKKPSIYLISSNRSAGKTTSVLLKFLKVFKETGKQCAILYRTRDEIKDTHLIFEDALTLYPEYGTEITSKRISNGVIDQLILDGQVLGYSLSLYNPDRVKPKSALFKDVDNVLFDEFQSESGFYLKKEVDKLVSVMISISRGGGKQHRNVNLYMLSNMVTILNPHYIYHGIHKRIKKDTKFIRGHGWICQFNYNESAANAIKDGNLAKAFDNRIMEYSTSNIYLNDDQMFCSTPKGKSIYICTIVVDGNKYGIREYFEEGLIYVTSKIDPSHKRVFTFKPGDHNQNTIMLSHASDTWKYIRQAYDAGFLRFDNMQAKNAIYDIFAIKTL